MPSVSDYFLEMEIEYLPSGHVRSMACEIIWVTYVQRWGKYKYRKNNDDCHMQDISSNMHTVLCFVLFLL